MVKNINISSKLKEITKDKLWLAPLAGFTDSVCRGISKELGADVVVSEMISARALVHSNAKTLKLAEFSESERPLGLQIFGAEPEIIAQGIKILLEFDPDFIDINMGCPMKKIVKTGSGSALLKDLNHLHQVVRSAHKITKNKVPLLAKIRSGWDNIKNVDEIVQTIEAAGADAITIHARTRNQMFSGKSNWVIIEKIKNLVSIPVIGNGDIEKPEDAEKMKEQTGCDSVMIGRGAMGRPWIFKQIKQYLATGEYTELVPRQRVKMLQLHFNRMKDHYGADKALRLIRKFLTGYTKGLKGSRKLRGELNLCESEVEFNKMIANFLQKL